MFEPRVSLTIFVFAPSAQLHPGRRGNREYTFPLTWQCSGLRISRVGWSRMSPLSVSVNFAPSFPCSDAYSGRSCDASVPMDPTFRQVLQDRLLLVRSPFVQLPFFPTYYLPYDFLNLLLLPAAQSPSHEHHDRCGTLSAPFVSDDGPSIHHDQRLVPSKVFGSIPPIV